MQGLARDDDHDGHEGEIVADDGPRAVTGNGKPIPDLSRLPEEQWREALRPLSRYGRIRAQNTAPPQRIMVAMALTGELLLEDDARRARATAAPPAEMPVGEPPPLTQRPSDASRRQVNFRLGAGEHARLVEAARLFGMRPSVLARVLTVRGVDRALSDARRDR